MEKFFYPRSVAVAGASQKENLGNHVVRNLKSGFDGDIYPINPNYDEIEGLPCFPSIDAVPGHVDLVIVLVPAKAVPALLESCARKGTRRVIIESAGFSETGDEGRTLQARCDEIARKNGIRLWGPNCMGNVNVHKQYFFTFMHPRIRSSGLLPGRISLIVQSGMMSAVFLAELARKGIGVAKACSIGNRADVNECDLIEFLENDADTEVIALYLESIPQGRRFARLAAASGKPIVLLKGGQSDAGAQAAMSHTSSLSGDSRLATSILANAGVTMADSIFQMMDMANTLAAIPKLNPACRIAIMTLSGGAGILACDALARCGLTIATLSEETKRKLADVFPPWMPPSNPIDLFPAVALRGREVAFRRSLDAALEDPGIDAVVIHFVAGLDESMPDQLQTIKKRADELGKTVIFWLMGLADGKRVFAERARAAGIAVHSDGPRLAECLAAAADFSAHRQQASKMAADPMPHLPEPKHLNLTTADTVLDEFDSKRLLNEWRIPVVEEMIADTPAEAWDFAERVGLPVVMKGLVPDKAHKTEHGLVKLGISDQVQLARSYEALQKRMGGSGRILVQKQICCDYELIAGFLRDAQFGPCVMFGLGGILAELEPDVMFALAPLTEAKAVQLIGSLRKRKLLQGFRGMPPLDEEAAARLLVNLGAFGAAHPEIEQIDINPLVVCKGAPLAVDANIVLKRAPSTNNAKRRS